jgi:hypothetical protein
MQYRNEVKRRSPHSSALVQRKIRATSGHQNFTSVLFKRLASDNYIISLTKRQGVIYTKKRVSYEEIWVITEETRVSYSNKYTKEIKRNKKK